MVMGIAALAGGFYYARVGCPEGQVALVAPTGAQCARMGYFSLSDGPNATAIQLAGENALQQWGTSSAALDQQFGALGSRSWANIGDQCLSEGRTRTAYKEAAAEIRGVLKSLDGTDCLVKSRASFGIRDGARVGARNGMCNQNEAKILDQRDRSEYGTSRPSFAYMVGKSVKRALAACKNKCLEGPQKECDKGVCTTTVYTSEECRKSCKVKDMKEATCNAIINSAQKTNWFYNLYAKVFG